jgi:hypothetical protein
MYFVFIYENRRMKPVVIVLRSRGRWGGRIMEEVNLRYIVSTHVNIRMYLPIQLSYATKNEIKLRMWLALRFHCSLNTRIIFHLFLYI